MRVTAFIDVLSHWCLAATPALLALERSLADDLHVEVIIAPIADGGRIGFHPESRRWAFRRGSLAYGTSLTSAWYENEESCTWHANAATAAAIELGASPIALVCAVSRSAMIDGALLAREQEAVRHIATHANLAEDRLRETMRHDDFKVRVLNGNARLRAIGCTERPSWELRNEIGDHAILQGVWQAEAILPLAQAMLSDERSYHRAGPPPEF